MTEIPKIVGQRLQAVAAVGEHPDPNLLGAFVEKVLPRREQVRVLEHLSRCTTCREVVSLTTPQPRIADAVSVVPAKAGWLAWPVLRWGAVVACVVVVGAVVTLRQQQGSRQIASTIAERKPGVESQLSAPGTPQAKNAGDKSAVADGLTASQQMARTAKPDGNSAAAAPGPVEMADARAGSDELVPGRAKAAESQDTVARKGIAVTGNTVAPVEGSNTAIIPLVSTNLAPRWTLSSDGSLQRSRDSGRTWQTIPVSSNTIFRALAANGLNIWVGGAAGALFHSSDAGLHCTQVRPVVNGEVLAGDIIGVEFTDTLHGKLTTSTEEIWITADAGQTWQK